MIVAITVRPQHGHDHESFATSIACTLHDLLETFDRETVFHVHEPGDGSATLLAACHPRLQLDLPELREALQTMIGDAWDVQFLAASYADDDPFIDQLWPDRFEEDEEDVVLCEDEE